MSSENIKKVILIILCLAIIIIPNLSMATVHDLGGTEEQLFSGRDQVVDVHLKVKMYAITLTAIVLFFLLIANEIFKYTSISKRILPILGFFILVIVSGVLSDFHDIVWSGVFQYYESTITFLSYFVIMFATYRVMSLSYARKYIQKSLYFCVIIVFLQAFFQYFGVNVFNLPVVNEFTGLLINASSIEYTTNTQSGVFAGLDNSNFMGSFIILPLSISLWDRNSKISLFAYISSIWMLIASNSAAGAIGFIVVAFVYAAFSDLTKEKLVKFYVPIVGIMTLYPMMNTVLSKLIIVDRNQYILLIGALVISIFVYTFRNIYVKSRIVSYGLVFILLVSSFSGVIFALKFTEDKMTTKTFTSYESGDNYLELYKGDYGFKIEMNDSSVSMKEVPSGKDIEFFEGEILFDRTEHFTDISGTYQIIEDEIAFKFDPINLVLLFKANHLFYQDLVDWHPITEVTRAESFGFNQHQQLGSNRGYIWSRTLPMLKNYIVLGSGSDTFSFVYPQEDFEGKLYGGFSHLTIVDKPHNFFLRYWVQFGFISLALFLGGVIWISWEGLRKNVAVPWIVALLAVLGTGMFNDIIAGISFLIYILIGLIIGELENHKELKKA